jgi:hypothetical protein
MILEADIERKLHRLADYGFKVLKLYTPGTIGVMDRMILRPRYSPGPPMFVELKRPGKKLRPLQRATAKDWKHRGCIVLKPCSTPGEVDQLCTDLITMIMPDYAFAKEDDHDPLPPD